MCMPTWITVPVWRSRDNMQEMALSFHCLGPRDQTHIVRLGSITRVAISPAPKQVLK